MFIDVVLVSLLLTLNIFHIFLFLGCRTTEDLVQILKQGDSSDKQKMNGCFLSKFFGIM